MSIAAIRKSFRTSPLSAHAFLIAAVAAATLMGAWFFEYVVKLEPCPLCLQQRIPYYIAIPFALAVGFLARDRSRAGLAVYGLYALAALMFASVLFGVYHAGVEWGWWQGPSTCAAGAGGAGGGNLIEALKGARVVPCNEAPIRILGISLAGYNALISTALAVLAFNAARGKK
jgi:disulfide bond formation protein DsbB